MPPRRGKPTPKAKARAQPRKKPVAKLARRKTSPRAKSAIKSLDDQQREFLKLERDTGASLLKAIGDAVSEPSSFGADALKKLSDALAVTTRIIRSALGLPETGLPGPTGPASADDRLIVEFITPPGAGVRKPTTPPPPGFSPPDGVIDTTAEDVTERPRHLPSNAQGTEMGEIEDALDDLLGEDPPGAPPT